MIVDYKIESVKFMNNAKIDKLNFENNEFLMNSRLNEVAKK